MDDVKLNQINAEWACLMRTEEYLQDFFSWGPLTNDYWKQNTRILLCNEESYDSGISGDTKIDISIIKRWMDNKNQTIKYSSVFIKSLLEAINTGIIPETNVMRKYYKMNSELLQSMRTIAYANYRKDNNEHRKHDKEYINDFLNPSCYRLENNKNSDNSQLFKEFVEALNPNIFIFSSEIGADIIKRIFTNVDSILYNCITKKDNCIYVSICHPCSSKFNYAYMQKTIKSIIDLL